MLGYGEAALLKNLILMMLCFVDLIGILHLLLWQTTLQLLILEQKEGMPAVPSMGGGGILSVTPGAEEDLKK